jgi:hypothetical protein
MDVTASWNASGEIAGIVSPSFVLMMMSFAITLLLLCFEQILANRAAVFAGLAFSRSNTCQQCPGETSPGSSVQPEALNSWESRSLKSERAVEQPSSLLRHLSNLRFTRQSMDLTWFLHVITTILPVASSRTSALCGMRWRVGKSHGIVRLVNPLRVSSAGHG